MEDRRLRFVRLTRFTTSLQHSSGAGHSHWQVV